MHGWPARERRAARRRRRRAAAPARGRPQAVRREARRSASRGRAAPPGARPRAAVDDARGERDVTDRPLDAGDRRDPLHRRDGRSARAQGRRTRHRRRPSSIVGRRGRRRRRRRTGRARGAEGARHQQSGRVGERDREQDRDERAGQRARAGRAGSARRCAAWLSPPVRSGVRRPLGGRARAAPGEAPVGHEHDAVRPGGGGRVVGDHDERAPAARRRCARSSASTSRPERVSSAPVGSSAKMTSGSPTSARAIATRCCWPPDSCGGTVAGAVREPDARRAPPRTAARGSAPPGEPRRQRDVLLGGERAEQVEGLEHEADALAPEPGERVLATTRRAPGRRAAPRPRWGGRARRRAAAASTCRSPTGP